MEMLIPNDSMSGKTCIVTGANAGIGRAITVGLSQMGATVVMVCRDQNRGEAALAEIKEESENDTLSLFIADLSSQKSIRQFAERFKAEYTALHVLINNAGVIPPQRTLTEDDLETQFAVNYLAGFLLTDLLLDTLKTSAPSRIINITSNSHKSATINFDDLQSTQSYDPQQVYPQTKLCNVLFTYELARRIQDTQVTVNCLHPGVVATKLLNDYHGASGVQSFMKKLLYGTPERGARTPLYLASSPDLKDVSGKYFENRKMVASSRNSYDLAIAEKLWQVSKNMTG